MIKPRSSPALSPRAGLKAFAVFTLLGDSRRDPVAHGSGASAAAADAGALDLPAETVVPHSVVSASSPRLSDGAGSRHEAIEPHEATMTVLGASLLWFGWFGSTPAARSPPAVSPRARLS